MLPSSFPESSLKRMYKINVLVITCKFCRVGNFLMEVWQCGYPICQHPGCWLANQDKSPKVPPLSKSITDAIEKSRKCNRVSGESKWLKRVDKVIAYYTLAGHFTDCSLPTVKLIEVDSGIPEREPKSLPKLPK